MAPLTASKQRTAKVLDSQYVAVPVNSGSVIFAGAIVCREAATGLAVPGADTAGLVPLGVSVDELDNTSGADGVVSGSGGERFIRVDVQGEQEFALEEGSSTPVIDGFAYIVDDDTVSADATTNELILGKFTRPGPDGGWFVDLERRPIDVPA